MNQSQLGISGILNRLKDNTYFLFLNKMRKESCNPAKVFAIAVILIQPFDMSKFLAVKRPPYAESLPDVWGLPAITLKNIEKPEVATLRVGKEKLNTEVKFLGSLGFDIINRGKYQLILMDVVAKLVGEEPSVIDAITIHTKYIQQLWTNDLLILKEAALRGSLCSRILLRSFDIPF